MTTEDLHSCISPAETLIDEARAGRMVILVDDEDRENEGDLVLPAQFATPDAINFMARHARGLICLALPRERVAFLGLSLMSPANGSRHETAFTVSIEAREGVSTGISAADRARTIAAAINPTGRPEDIVTPGHVFPLLARDGGTLVRAGHTEAAVDIARLAGLNPAGVICEIMNEDGSMARLPELARFAREHRVKLGTIADLIAHRRRTEKLVRRVTETRFSDPETGTWRMLVYATELIPYCEHIVLMKGDVADGAPVLTRMHAVNVVESLMQAPSAETFRGALRMIAEAGRGVLVILREWRPTHYSDLVAQHARTGKRVRDVRDNGVGAQILADLEIRKLILLTNSRHHVIGLDGFGLEVVEEREVPLPRLRDTEAGQSPGKNAA